MMTFRDFSRVKEFLDALDKGGNHNIPASKSTHLSSDNDTKIMGELSTE